jgi:flagellar protein FliO/FliZ
VDTLFLALRVVVSLGAVLGVIWFAQRRLTRGKLLQKVVREIRVVGRQSVGAKASVVLIEADGQRLMLGVTDHSITVLNSAPLAAPETSPEASIAPAPAQATGDFAALLADAESTRSSETAPIAWKRPRASPRRGSHR